MKRSIIIYFFIFVIGIIIGYFLLHGNGQKSGKYAYKHITVKTYKTLTNTDKVLPGQNSSTPQFGLDSMTYQYPLDTMCCCYNYFYNPANPNTFWLTNWNDCGPNYLSVLTVPNPSMSGAISFYAQITVPATSYIANYLLPPWGKAYIPLVGPLGGGASFSIATTVSTDGGVTFVPVSSSPPPVVVGSGLDSIPSVTLNPPPSTTCNSQITAEIYFGSDSDIACVAYKTYCASDTIPGKPLNPLLYPIPRH
ncbi:MAG TPA: hypothetical protein VEW28_00485 [Candidatus Kapabacteria bacterium]|nr:hypothetical protein [Candidatus Kapabacteria bacterium]